MSEPRIYHEGTCSFCGQKASVLEPLFGDNNKKLCSRCNNKEYKKTVDWFKNNEYFKNIPDELLEKTDFCEPNPALLKFVIYTVAVVVFIIIYACK